MPKTCKNCQYFAEPANKKAGFSECRRIPPVPQYYLVPNPDGNGVPILQSFAAYVGVTRDNPACGEYREKVVRLTVEGTAV